MLASCFIPFNSHIPSDHIPSELNNPYDPYVPVLCRIAAREFQQFISKNQESWGHNFGIFAQKEGPLRGKMFGVLVVDHPELGLGYLSTVSGNLTDKKHPKQFVPSVFDESTDNFFINRGMEELIQFGRQIEVETNDSKIQEIKTARKAKSHELQQQLFDNYAFLNLEGETKNICLIFEEAIGKMPPSGAGECAAPKLLNYAFQHQLKPLAIAEFWWGSSPNSGERKHGYFYQACKNKCLPILNFMLQKDLLAVESE